MSETCSKCWAAPAVQAAGGYTGVCASCLDELERHPQYQLTYQTGVALAELDGDASHIVSWPFAALDQLAGPLPPGAVAYVAGFSGQGKTTFIVECIRRWLAERYKVYVMPLESQAPEWRVRFACSTIGVEPGDALSGRLKQRAHRGDAEAVRTREAIRAVLNETAALMRRDSPLYVSPDPFLDFTTFRLNVRLAAEWGYRLIIVDHIDHVRATNDRGSVTAASAQIQYGALELAQQYGVVLILMSQVNLNAVRGQHDQLAKYRPLREDHLYMSAAAKLQIATQVLGLFRPLREDATTDEKRAASAGEVDPTTLLAPNRMGLNAMKLRHYGQRTGQRIHLAYDHGRVRDLDVAERAADEARAHGIRSNRDLTA